jgi:hypothetical protein
LNGKTLGELTMKHLDFKFYRPRLAGQDAFEQEFQWTAVVFEITKGVFLYWNPQPYDIDSPEQWGEGIPFEYTVEELDEYGYDLDDLALQLGIYHAWGLDL